MLKQSQLSTVLEHLIKLERKINPILASDDYFSPDKESPLTIIELCQKLFENNWVKTDLMSLVLNVELHESSLEQFRNSGNFFRDMKKTPDDVYLIKCELYMSNAEYKVLYQTLFSGDAIETMAHYNDVFEVQKKWDLYFKFALNAASVVMNITENRLPEGNVPKQRVVGYQLCPILVTELAVAYNFFFGANNPMPLKEFIIRKIGVDMRRVDGRPQIQLSIEFFGIGMDGQSKHNVFPILLVNLQESADNYIQIFSEDLKKNLSQHSSTGRGRILQCKIY